MSGKIESVELDDTLIFSAAHVVKTISGKRHAAVVALEKYIVVLLKGKMFGYLYFTALRT